ncbi:MAG: hypothetical protein AAF311_06855 [Pseudomonadota bacterium]
MKMKEKTKACNRLATLAMGFALTAATAGPALADAPGRDWVGDPVHAPIEAITQHGDRIEIRLKKGYFDTDKGLANIYAALRTEATEFCRQGHATRTGRDTYRSGACATALLDELVASTGHDGLIGLHEDRRY